MCFSQIQKRAVPVNNIWYFIAFRLFCKLSEKNKGRNNFLVLLYPSLSQLLWLGPVPAVVLTTEPKTQG